MYNYDDVKLTCPFCKSEMELQTILIGNLKMPYYVIYFCTNDKCDFNLEIDFDKFDDRLHFLEKDG